MLLLIEKTLVALLQEGIYASRRTRGMCSRGQRICLHKRTHKCSSPKGAGGAGLHRCHVCTYSCLRPSTCSMVVIPAREKLSLYWLILMDSSHSGTDRNTVPSQPLVLGRRMETLRSQGPAWLVGVTVQYRGKA